MGLYSAVLDYLHSLESSEIIEVYNDYIRYLSCAMEHMAFSMEVFDDFMSDRAPYDVARDVAAGDFKPYDDYWTYNEAGHIVTFSAWNDKNSPICLSDIAAFVADCVDGFENDEIEKIVSEFTGRGEQ